MVTRAMGRLWLMVLWTRVVMVLVLLVGRLVLTSATWGVSGSRLFSAGFLVI